MAPHAGFFDLMICAHTGESPMSRIATLLIGLVLLLSLTACNTIGGAGQYIENAGEGIQDAAES